jgi:hypothetical protein
MFNCGSWLTLILIFTIQPRQHFFVKRPSVDVPPCEPTASIVTLRQFSLDATALLTDLIEARPVILTEVNVKTHDGGQLISGLVDCDATLDFLL